ncbi:MAG TPA: efflux RND transporter periplasmic adaptor subunit [Saprospiraceae bacterium]|nr:efflux RND transporter periplasmic adaptor subunit [Saprospiraceae bacterium]HPN71478.1 efflux RND transporter periplasmic adaptor subunit [Saprospiraceae bacterium]
MKGYIYIGILILAFSACKSKTEETYDLTTLDGKIQKLEDLKDQQTTITEEIAKLESEIMKLDPTKAIKPKLISISEIAPEGFESYINLQGSIQSENISYVAPRNGMGGYVKQLYIKEGQAVKKGQLILKMDDLVLRQSIEASKSQLAFAENLLARTKALWDQKIGTEVQLLNAQNNVDAIKNQISVQEEQLKTYLVYADQSGVAEIVNIKTGELFSGVGAQGPQIQIVNNGDLRVNVDIPENYASQVKQGDEVLIEVPALGKSFKSTISRISMSVNASSRGFAAECRIPSAAGLKPNMAATVKILNHSNSKAIVIPVNIVQSDETGKYVYVMADKDGVKIAEKRTVSLGELYGSDIEILTGLNPGDKLVTRGYQDLYQGQVLKNI